MPPHHSLDAPSTPMDHLSGFGIGMVPERVTGSAQPSHVNRTAVVTVGGLNSAGVSTRLAGCWADDVATSQSTVDSPMCLTNELDPVRIALVPSLSAQGTFSAVLGGVRPRLRALRLGISSVARLPVPRPSVPCALVVGRIAGVALLTMSLVRRCVRLSLAGLADEQTPASSLRSLQNVERSRSAAPGTWWDRLLLHRGIHPLAVSRPRPVSAGRGGIVLPELYHKCWVAFA